jgi:hypothetical protein
MKKILMILMALTLTGCLEDKSSSTPPTQCFDIVQGKDAVRHIMFNKCTGETWMLTYVNLYSEGKPTGEFTYRWSPLITESIEPHLSYGK